VKASELHPVGGPLVQVFSPKDLMDALHAEEKPLKQFHAQLAETLSSAAHCYHRDLGRLCSHLQSA
jgi:hypothetical protein